MHIHASKRTSATLFSNNGVDVFTQDARKFQTIGYSDAADNTPLIKNEPLCNILPRIM